jgi:flagellar assembly protein FliH
MTRAGRRCGRRAGAQAEAAGREEALRLATTLENLEKCITELNQAVADDLLALSMEIARQLVRQTVAAKPDVVLGVIREALDQLPLLHAAIRLNPEDASLARLRAGDQLTHAGHRIHEDPKLKRGDVIIEAGGSHLDASLASRWRRVVEALGQDAPWIDIPGET